MKCDQDLCYDLKKLRWQDELNPRVRCAFGNVFKEKSHFQFNRIPNSLFCLLLLSHKLVGALHNRGFKDMKNDFMFLRPLTMRQIFFWVSKSHISLNSLWKVSLTGQWQFGLRPWCNLHLHLQSVIDWSMTLCLWTSALWPCVIDCGQWQCGHKLALKKCHWLDVYYTILY